MHIKAFWGSSHGGSTDVGVIFRRHGYSLGVASGRQRRKGNEARRELETSKAEMHKRALLDRNRREQIRRLKKARIRLEESLRSKQSELDAKDKHWAQGNQDY